MKALVRVWEPAGSEYKYRFDSGSTLEVTPSFAVSMLRALADDIEKEYDLKKKSPYTHRGADGGIH